MKEFIHKWITQNIGLKILSLFIAILLWFIFTNLEDPLSTAYFEVPVEVQHLSEYREQNRFIEIEGEQDLDNLKVNVYYRGRTSEVEALKNRNPSAFLRAYIDLYEIDPEDPNRLMIHYEVIDRTLKGELYSYRNKSYYSVDVEDYITVEIDIRYEITGDPEVGYMYLPDDPDIQLSPKTITLTGPSEQVSAVSYAFVQVNLDGESSNASKIGEAILKDENGQDVSYSRDVIRTSVNDVSVYIPIYTYKTVKVQPFLTGEVQEGYEYANDLRQDIVGVFVDEGQHGRAGRGMKFIPGDDSDLIFLFPDIKAGFAEGFIQMLFHVCKPASVLQLAAYLIDRQIVIRKRLFAQDQLPCRLPTCYEACQVVFIRAQILELLDQQVLICRRDKVVDFSLHGPDPDLHAAVIELEIEVV